MRTDNLRKLQQNEMLKLTFFEGVGPNITRVYNKQLVLDLGPHIVSLLESWFGLGPSNLHLGPANLGPAPIDKQNPSWIRATQDRPKPDPYSSFTRMVT